MAADDGHGDTASFLVFLREDVWLSNRRQLIKRYVSIEPHREFQGHCMSLCWRSVRDMDNARDFPTFRVANSPFTLGFRIVLRRVLIAARVPSPFRKCIATLWLHVPSLSPCAAYIGPKTCCCLSPEPFSICFAQACMRGHGRPFRQCG